MSRRLSGAAMPETYMLLYSLALGNMIPSTHSSARDIGGGSIFLKWSVCPLNNPVCERRVNLLVYSLSLHRHSSFYGLIINK